MTRLPRLTALAARERHAELLGEAMDGAGSWPLPVRLALGSDETRPIASVAMALARSLELSFALPEPVRELLDRLVEGLDRTFDLTPAAAAAALAALSRARSEASDITLWSQARPVDPAAAERMDRAIDRCSEALLTSLALPTLDDASLAAAVILLAPEPSVDVTPLLAAADERGLAHHPALGAAILSAERRVLATPLAA